MRVGVAEIRGRRGEKAGSIPAGVSPLMHHEIVPCPIRGTIRENVSTSRGTFSSGHAFRGYFLSHEVRSAAKNLGRVDPEATRCPARGKQPSRPGGRNAVSPNT